MQKKKKNDLVAAFQSIERFHRRRSVFAVHVTLSLAFQVALRANWYASYAAYGKGFENNFFADRFIVSAALLILLVGHFSLMTLMESKDRLVVQALQERQADFEDDSAKADDEADEDREYEPEAPVQHKGKR